MYPIAGLEIVAPVIFIVLVCLFPLIGLLAGWKKGVFWGAGFLIFYIIGLLIWTFLGITIAEKLSTLITNLIAQITGQTFTEPLPAEFVKSILTPFYFLIVMAISVLILLINYFAWYRRVVGLKKVKVKDKKTGKITKEYLKVNKNAGKGWYKAVNRLGGFVALGALTLPSTITFTQFAYLATTTTASRENNKLSKDVYERLQVFSKPGIEKAFYIQNDTFLDYDSLLSVVSLIGKEIDVPGVGTKKVTDLIVEDVGSGVANIFASLTDTSQYEPTITPEPQPMVTDYEVSLNINFNSTWSVIGQLANSWNLLLKDYGIQIQSFFDSLNVLPTINSILKPFIATIFDKFEFKEFSEDTKITIPVEIVSGQPPINIEIPVYRVLFSGGSINVQQQIDIFTYKIHGTYPSIIQTLVEQYLDPKTEVTRLDQILIPKKNVENIVSTFDSFFSITPTYIAKLQTEEPIVKDPRGLMTECISKFLQSVITYEEPTPPNQQ